MLVLNIVVTSRIFVSSFCDDSDDVAVEPKHVATFVIDNIISCVLTEITLEYLSENTTVWLQLKYHPNVLCRNG